MKMNLFWISTLLFCAVNSENQKTFKTDIDEDYQHLLATVDKLQKSVIQLQQNDEEQRERISYLESQHTIINNVKHNLESKEKGTYTAVACYTENIFLSCEGERTIFVVNATYGQFSQQYSFDCPSTCCPPHPTDDCMVTVEDTAPQDWLAIKYLCDNKTQCSFAYLGSEIGECQEGYLADYMQVYYSCLPDGGTNIGFTAYASDTRQYDAGDLVLFDDIVSNIGGHYFTSTSTFIAPFDGIYVFSVQAISVASTVYLDIMRNADEVVMAWMTSEEATTYTHGANSVLLECSAGDLIWIRNRYGSQEGLYGYSDRTTTFSGYLVNLS